MENIFPHNNYITFYQDVKYLPIFFVVSPFSLDFFNMRLDFMYIFLL